jgi:hypothetical protein
MVSISENRLNFIKSFGFDVSGFIIDQAPPPPMSPNHCEECDAYMVLDFATSDLVCTSCGLCSYLMEAGETVPNRFARSEGGSLCKPKCYEPSKYVLEKLR